MKKNQLAIQEILNGYAVICRGNDATEKSKIQKWPPLLSKTTTPSPKINKKKTIKLSINSNVNRKYFVFPNPQQPVLHMAAARDLLKVLISQCVPSLLVAGHFQNDQQPSAVEGEVANT